MRDNPWGVSKGSEGNVDKKRRERNIDLPKPTTGSDYNIGYCIFVKAFCFDESTSAFIVLTILSRSSFIFCITALNILSIISFIESVLATGISFLEYSLSYLYTFLSRYI